MANELIDRPEYAVTPAGVLSVVIYSPRLEKQIMYRLRPSERPRSQAARNINTKLEPAIHLLRRSSQTLLRLQRFRHPPTRLQPQF